MPENKEWQEVIKLAEKYDFIHYCYGGVAILIEDKERREELAKNN